MFHQVVIRDEDRAAQRFFLKGMDPSKDPAVYEMRVMTFGGNFLTYQSPVREECECE